MMRKCLVIFFISLYLVGTTEAYQLLKLPAFMAHFVQHCRENPAMSMMDFLEEHYAEEQVIDADWQQDMQLPFKSHEDNSSLMPLSYFPPNAHLVFKQPEIWLSTFRAPRIGSLVPGLYTADIFQPPRIGAFA